MSETKQWTAHGNGVHEGSSAIAVTFGDKAHDHARLIAASPDMRDALEATEAAEDHWANCEDCEGSESPELGCEVGFKLADNARLMRRAAVAKAKGKP